MRIIGFSKKWDKLSNPEFSTFRYPRKDSDKGRDWRVSETVQVVLHPRSNKNREILGTAEIIRKEERSIATIGYTVTNKEAAADGFTDVLDMRTWFRKTYGKNADPVMNKLTLKWISRPVRQDRGEIKR